jgi:hypothetical protein
MSTPVIAEPGSCGYGMVYFLRINPRFVRHGTFARGFGSSLRVADRPRLGMASAPWRPDIGRREDSGMESLTRHAPPPGGNPGLSAPVTRPAGYPGDTTRPRGGNCHRARGRSLRSVQSGCQCQAGRRVLSGLGADVTNFEAYLRASG